MIKRKLGQQIYVPVFSIFSFCIFWELLVWANGWPDYKMASPSDIGPAFWKFKSLPSITLASISLFNEF